MTAVSKAGGNLTFIIGQGGQQNRTANDGVVVVPESSEPVGKPIDFSHGFTKLEGSATDDLLAISKAIKAVRAEGWPVRVLMVTSADAALGKTPDRSQTIAQQRGQVCEAKLLEFGIEIDRQICVADGDGQGWR